MQEKRITFYDSGVERFKGGDEQEKMQHIKRYIADEHMNKKKTALNMDDWELTSEVR
jgi:hypothetical protein